LKFPGLDGKIAVDFFFSSNVAFVYGAGSLAVTCQITPNTVPVELICAGINQYEL